MKRHEIENLLNKPRSEALDALEVPLALWDAATETWDRDPDEPTCVPCATDPKHDGPCDWHEPEGNRDPAHPVEWPPADPPRPTPESEARARLDRIEAVLDALLAESTTPHRSRVIHEYRRRDDVGWPTKKESR